MKGNCSECEFKMNCKKDPATCDDWTQVVAYWEQRMPSGYTCTECGGYAETDQHGNPILADHCPHCGKKLFRRVTYNFQKNQVTEMPAEMEAFLADLEAACKKHGLAICTEDGSPIIVREYNRENLGHLYEANKDYIAPNTSHQIYGAIAPTLDAPLSRKAVHDNIGEQGLFAYLTFDDIIQHGLHTDEYGLFYFTEEQGRIAGVMYELMRRYITNFPSLALEHAADITEEVEKGKMHV